MSKPWENRTVSFVYRYTPKAVQCESCVSLDPKLAWCSFDLENAWSFVFIE